MLDARGAPIAAPTDPRKALAASSATTGAPQSLDSRDRFIDADKGSTITVALRLRTPRGTGTGTARPSLSAELGIVERARNDALLVTLPIVILGAVGVALLTAFRVRRVAPAAELTSLGALDKEIKPGFPDGIGGLARSFDRIRLRLADTFNTSATNRAHLQLLLSRLRQGVIGVTADGHVSYANTAVARITGASDLAPGSQLPDPLGNLSLGEFTARLLDVGTLLDRRRVTVTDGREIEVVGFLPGPHGPEAAAALVTTDLSIEARYERAEREFVANAAHELRTPPSTAIGSVDVLLAGADVNPENRERFLSHIRREALRLTRPSRALLVLARTHAGGASQSEVTTRLLPILNAIRESVEPNPGVDLTLFCPPQPATIGDPGLIEQACFDLVSNAATNTSTGTIAIDAALAGTGRDGLSRSPTPAAASLPRNANAFRTVLPRRRARTRTVRTRPGDRAVLRRRPRRGAGDHIVPRGLRRSPS